MKLLVKALAPGLVVACLGLGVSAAENDLKTGAAHEEQGQFFRAAEIYLGAVRQKPRDQKARRALERTADRAIEEKFRNAEALSADLKTAEAITELETAARFTAKLAEIGIRPMRAGEIAARKERLVSDRVEALLAEIERARSGGSWSAAIAHIEQVEALRPGLDETRDLLHDTWIAWGDANVREGRLRAAVERYEHASRVGRVSNGAARAAAIRVGLAESALRRGACRAATADLRRAEQLVAGSVKPELLDQAKSCAATCVRVSVVADRDSGLPEGASDHLLTALRKQVLADSSEFLRISDSAGPSTCDRRTLPGPDGEPMSVGPYSAVLRVTAVSMVRQPASASTRHARQQQAGTEMTTSYEEFRENLNGTISGWVTVTDQRATAMSVPMPLRANGQATARWQRSPVSTMTRADAWTGQSDTTVVIDVSGRAKPQADKARERARRDLVDTLSQNLVTEAARRILSTLDVEPAVADPTKLAGID